MTDGTFFEEGIIEQKLNQKLGSIARNDKLSEKNKELILKYLREAELGKTIIKGQKKKIGAGRNYQTAVYLKQMALLWFKKDLDTVTMEDMEKFIINLDKIKNIKRL